MASELKTYSSGRLLVNGQLASEAIEFSVTSEAGLQEVFTLHRGFSGMSRGAGKVDITIKSAIPRSGVEIDFEQYMDDMEEIEVQVLAGGRTRTYQLYVQSVGENYQVNQSSGLDVKTTGIKLQT